MLHTSEPVCYFPNSENSLNTCDGMSGTTLFLWVSFLFSFFFAPYIFSAQKGAIVQAFVR